MPHAGSIALMERILAEAPFRDAPPVILDLGAAGLEKRFEGIARFCHLIAADADARDFSGADGRYANWRGSTIVNACITADVTGHVEFYLTSDAHCSSSLPPQTGSLGKWMFARKFEVTERSELPSMSIPDLMLASGFDYVDWIKLDTQGTDLRLLRAIPDFAWRRAGVIQMEPGIMDAYVGEDKLADVLDFFDGEDFFVSDLDVRGTQRVDPSEWDRQPEIVRRWPDRVLRPSAGWAEVTYLRAFTSTADYGMRELLWGWVTASLFEQWGHAIEVAKSGSALFPDPVFLECERQSRNAMASRRPLALLEGAHRAARRVRARDF